MDYQKLNTKARSAMRLSAAIICLCCAMVLITVYIILRLKLDDLPQWVTMLLALLLLLMAAWVLFSPAVRWRRYAWYIDQEQVIAQEGLWFITRTMAPVERIHQIAVQRGPVLRLYGLAEVECTTAGGQVKIKWLEVEQADRLAAMLQQRVRQLVLQQLQEATDE